MRIRLKGINCYTARLADGTTKTYWYAWKGGPRLMGEPGTPEFIASYNEAAAQKIKAPKGQLLSLLQSYQASDDFRQRFPVVLAQGVFEGWNRGRDVQRSGAERR